MKRIVLLLLTSLIVFINNSSAQTLLYQESFETDGEGVSYRSNSFNDNSGGFFCRSDSSGYPFTQPIKYLDGDWCWGSADVDEPANPLGANEKGYLVLQTLDVAAHGEIKIYFTIAANGPDHLRFEEDDEFLIQYAFDDNIITSAQSADDVVDSVSQVNGGNYTNAIAFYGKNPSDDLARDYDLDGFADSSSHAVGTGLKIYSCLVPNNGNSLLSLRIICGQNTGSEDIAFDNIRVIGQGAPCILPSLPVVTYGPTIACVGSITMLFISGDLNDATEWYIYRDSLGGVFEGSTANNAFIVTPYDTTTYFVRGEGGCVIPREATSLTIMTTPRDDPAFSYPQTAFCVNESDPLPIVTGLPNGGYTAAPGIELSFDTGEINLSESDPGVYNITYTTIGFCVSYAYQDITINPMDDPSFTYPSGVFCPNNEDPIPTIIGLVGGTFTSTSGLNISPSSGIIDLSTSTPGMYDVTYTTSGICPDSSTSSIVINPLDDASFNYNSVTYCIDASDPTPLVTGLSGGTFSSSNGLSISPTTGTIDLSESTAGIYNVSYTSNGICPNTSIASVNILALDDASFSYNDSSFCPSDSDPVPTITGISGGLFSSTAGLSIAVEIGRIDLDGSIPGVYNISYATSGACPNTSDTIVTINAMDNTGFNYDNDSYCENDINPIPSITGLNGGIFSSTTGLSISSSTGTIDIESSLQGSYNITYTTVGVCPDSSSVPVSLHLMDNASFIYSAAEYCINTSDPSPIITGLPAGIFSSSTGLSISPSLGTIDVSASIAGTYTVSYTSTGPCPSISNSLVIITDLDDASFNYDAEVYCINASDPTPTITGSTGGSFTSIPVGLVLNSNSGQIDVSASTPNTYFITYTTSGSCQNISNIIVTISDLEDASFNYDNSVYCTNNNDPTPSITGVPGGIFSAAQGLVLNDITGQIDLSASLADNYSVSYLTQGTCSSSAEVNISINTAESSLETEYVCSGGTYTFPDGFTLNNIENQVVYTSILQTINLCDSIIETTLLIKPTYYFTDVTTVCSGESYTCHDGSIYNNITSPITHTNTFQTEQMCDSIIMTTINVNPVYSLSETQTICFGESYTFPDGITIDNINSMTIHTSHLLTESLCDSIIETTLQIKPIYTISETNYVCSGGYYTFPDGTTQSNITEQVVYTSHLTTDFFCDSNISTTIELYPNYNESEIIFVCYGSSYQFPDGTVQDNITSQVIHTSNLSSEFNCDSNIVTLLNLYPIYNDSETHIICSGESYTFPDGTTQDNITNPILYTSNLQSENFCDSIIETTITVNTVNVSLVQDNDLLTANALSVNYQWLDCDENYSVIVGESQQEFTATVNGSYAVEITEGTCVDTSICYDITNVLIKAFEIEGNIVVYPNPNEGLFTIALNQKYESLEINLRDINGKLIKNSKYSSIENIEFNIDGAKGIYFLELVTAENRIFVKVVKQ